MSVVEHVPVDGSDVGQDMGVVGVNFLVFEFKPDQRGVLRRLVCLEQLEAVAGALVNEVALNPVAVQVRDERACCGAADDRLVLVKDNAADVSALVFVGDAFINLDLGHIF